MEQYMSAEELRQFVAVTPGIVFIYMSGDQSTCHDDISFRATYEHVVYETKAPVLSFSDASGANRLTFHGVEEILYDDGPFLGTCIVKNKGSVHRFIVRKM